MKRTPILLTAAAGLWALLWAGALAAEESAAQVGPNADAFVMLDEKSKEESFFQSHEILQKRVSINFIDTPVANILRAIRLQAGLNMIMDPAVVTGNMSIHLENVRLGTALDAILKNKKLAYVITGDENIVRIATGAELGAQAVETVTEIVPVEWADATQLAATLNSMATKGADGGGAGAEGGAGGTADIGSVIADKETNSLIITDTPPKVQFIIDTILPKLDRPPFQVQISARLVEMQTNAFRELGSEFRMWRRDSHNNSPATGIVNEFVQGTAGTPAMPGTPAQPAIFDAFGNILSPAVPATPGSPASPGTPGSVQAVEALVDTAFTNLLGSQAAGTLMIGDELSILGQGFNLSAILTAYEDRNIIEVLVEPTVVTLNNIEASIDIIQMVPYIDQAQNQESTASTAKFSEAGVRITVTPMITPSNNVRLNLETTQMIDVGRYQGVPIIDTRTAKTNVIVKSGDTVMLGGLRQLRLGDQRQGVPWLQNIPVLGWLFKHKINSQAKTDLYIFVTPTVLAQPESADVEPRPLGLTTEQQGFHDRIDVNWELPDYFFDDVKVDEDMD